MEVFQHAIEACLKTADSGVSGASSLTEALLLNVSAKCSRAGLRAKLKSEGFEGLYNNLFLPKAEHGQNWVDATISFLSADAAQVFYEKFEMARVRGLSCTRPLRVKLASAVAMNPAPADMPSGLAALVSLQRSKIHSTQVTTLMIRHVPLRCSEDTLLNEIVAAGFGGRFDFFYMPMESRGPRNRALAFINLVTEDVAIEFYEHFHGQVLRAFPDHRPLMCLPGDTQGYEANLQFFQTTVLQNGGNHGLLASLPLFLRGVPGHLSWSPCEEQVHSL